MMENRLKPYLLVNAIETNRIFKYQAINIISSHLLRKQSIKSFMFQVSSYAGMIQGKKPPTSCLLPFQNMFFESL